MSAREAVVLFVLFISQAIAELYVIQTYSDPAQTKSVSSSSTLTRPSISSSVSVCSTDGATGSAN